MIKVKKGEKLALKFESNLNLQGVTITYDIRNFQNQILKTGNGKVDNKVIYTDEIEFDLKEGIYEVIVNIISPTEYKKIYEWLMVEL